MKDTYKVKILTKMFEQEIKQPPLEKYGAHLTHWDKSIAPITLDEGALKVLIDYYSK